jgi:hypothetical protein
MLSIGPLPGMVRDDRPDLVSLHDRICTPCRTWKVSVVRAEPMRTNLPVKPRTYDLPYTRRSLSTIRSSRHFKEGEIFPLLETS